MACKNTITTAEALTFADFTEFLHKLHKDKLYNWEAYSLLSFVSGCRGGDVLKMRWLDVLDKDELIVCEQKTGKVRRIPFNTEIQAKFKAIWNSADKPNRALYIMQQDKGSEPVSIQYVNRTLKKFKERYKVPIGNFSTHTFRKTFGRHVYDSMGRTEESLLLLSKIFRHASIGTTKIYLGITQGEINNIYESISLKI